MRVTIPIDLSTRSFIPLPRFFKSRRVPPLLNQSLVLIPEQSGFQHNTHHVPWYMMCVMLKDLRLTVHHSSSVTFFFPDSRLLLFCCNKIIIILRISVYDRRDGASESAPSPSPPSSLTHVHRCIGSHNPTWKTLTNSSRLTYLSVYDIRDAASEPTPSPSPPSSLTHVHNTAWHTIPHPPHTHTPHD
jgi:hypothetical protein